VHPSREEPADVAPEVGDQREEGAQVQGDVEGLVQLRVLEEEVPVEQPGDDQQMPGTGDRQELGESLDDAQDDGLQDGQGGSFAGRRCGDAPEEAPPSLSLAHGIPVQTP